MLCCRCGNYTVSCLGANMRQTRVNVLWRQKESFLQQLSTRAFLWKVILFICSDETQSAYWYNNVHPVVKIKPFFYLISFHLTVVTDFLQDIISSHHFESHVVSHSPPNQEKMKRSQQHWQVNYILAWHFIFTILFTSLTIVQHIFIPLTLNSTFIVLFVPE